jgi:hydrocephalus-inducing protein
LEEEVTVQGKCDEVQVQVPASVVLRAKAVTEVSVQYRPLLVAEKDAAVKFSSPDLGEFDYKLRLKGVPTGPERQLEFNVPLGSSEVKKFRFTSWFSGKTDYVSSFKDKGAAGFTGEAKVAAQQAGGELTLDVTFEPTSIGEHHKDTLIVQSAEGGLYECPVIGRCLPPKPKGPIDLKGGNGSVPFKNVFNKDVDFKFSVDNPAFTVKPGEVIKSKGTANIAVAFKEVPGQPKTGKLVVTCADVPAPWVFYLRA